MTLFDLLDASRRAAPAALAVNDLTYEALHASYMRVLGRLRERGVGVGDLAALCLGAIVVPVNVMYRAADLEHVLRNAGVTFVIGSETTKSHVKNLAGSYEIIDVADLEGWAADKS